MTFHMGFLKPGAAAVATIVVAVGSAGAVMSSPDGMNWTDRTAAENNTWRGVAYSPSLGLFCAVASDGTNLVMTSPDGVTWTSQTAAEQNAWNGIDWSPTLNLFVAVASNGTNRIMTSPDGITWTPHTAPGTATTWQDVIWVGGSINKFVAIATGGTGHTMTSANGTSWTDRTSSVSAKKLAFSSSIPIVAGVDDSIVISAPDPASTWTQNTQPENNSYRSVAWSPSLALFAAVASTGTHRVITSSDGVNWSNQNASDATAWFGICWSPTLGLFIAVTASAAPTHNVMTSNNGTSWTGLTGGAGNLAHRSVCSNN